MGSLQHLMRKFNKKCYYCKKQVFINKNITFNNHPLSATRDHIIPSSRGGGNNGGAINIVLSCFDCNQKKRNNFLEIHKILKLE